MNSSAFCEAIREASQKIILLIMQPGGAPTQWGPGILFILFFCHLFSARVNNEHTLGVYPNDVLSCPIFRKGNR